MSGALRLVGVVALVLGLGAATVAGPAGARARLRLVVRPAAAVADPSLGPAPAPRRRAGLVLVAAALSGLILAAALAGPVGVVAAAGYGVAGRRALRQRARNRADAAARDAGTVALAGLADDLRAGQTPIAALHTAVHALERDPAIAPVSAALAATRVGLAGSTGAAGDVVGALRAVPGPLAPAFGRLASAWALTDSGIPLAEVVDRLDVELRLQRRAAERAEAHTASARTTARLVACLPVLGLGIGQVLGADPFAVLTQTRAGAACAVAAMLLHLVGFGWASRLGRVEAR